jgi:hypothetical protein
MIQILRISAGAIVWALHFAAIYGVTALACARNLPGLVPWAVGIATALAAAAAVALIAVRTPDFAGWVASGVAALALLAILWEAASVLVVPACA